MALAVLAVLGLGAFVGVGFSSVFPRLRPRLSRLAPNRRSNLLLAAAAAPLLAGVAGASTLVGPALLAELGVGEGHCHGHGDAPVGFCLAHPPSDEVGLIPWFLLGGLALLAATRLATKFRRSRRARRINAALIRAGTEEQVGFLTLPTSRPLALSVGLFRPRVLISAGLIARLSPAQLQAVVAHEAAHSRCRDALGQYLAGLLSFLHLPKTRQGLRADLILAHEQRCDERAAEKVGDPLLVAETILAVKRMFRTSFPETEPVALAFAEHHTAARVALLLNGDCHLAGRSILSFAAWSAIPLISAAPAAFLWTSRSPFCC
ncbi:MAG: M56 family metallopeptidase [Deferrisomatales bacterium]|nr:M56 family metallopeptidase [Deferrisomatales bacterium]